MNANQRIVSKNPFYFIVFLALVFAALFFLFNTSKIAGFQQLNGIHNQLLDIIFSGCTFLGDGLFSILMVVFFWVFLKKRNLAFQILLAYMISGIGAQLLKRIFKAPRPREIIDPAHYAYFFPGNTAVGWDSFPSGHTTSAFALATLLALFLNKKTWSLVLLIAAILVGYSRIYLGQHFPQDVTGGAIWGTLVGAIVYYTVQLPAKWSKKSDSPNTI